MNTLSPVRNSLVMCLAILCCQRPCWGTRRPPESRLGIPSAISETTSSGADGAEVQEVTRRNPYGHGRSPPGTGPSVVVRRRS